MIAVITDSHFGARSFNKSIFRLQIGFFEDQFFPFLVKNDIKDVLFLGDFVDNRNFMDLWLMDELKARFFPWFDANGVKLHCLVGNHDTYYKNDIKPNFFGENVNEYKNVIPYEKNKIVTIDDLKIAMCPWITSYKKFKMPKKADVVCGHFDIKTFPMVKGIDSRDGFDRSQFKQYKLVLSGHYHINSKKGNIHYVGSPYQISWSDYNIEKGFYVIDKKLKPKFIKNAISPKFLKIYYHEENGKQKFQVGGFKPPKLVEMSSEDVTKLAGMNYCKVIVEKISSQTLFEDFYNIISLKSKDGFKIEIIDIDELIESIDYDAMEGVILGEGSIMDAINQYVDAIKFESGINKKLLLTICQHLYKEAEEKTVDIQTEV